MKRLGFLAAAAGLAAANLWAAGTTAGAAPPPNILLIMADDLGFSDIGCYGGEIATPNLDALAADGLRFTQFYNTGRCWPTRSALMSGYYPQQIHMDPPRGRLPDWTALLPRRLQPQGYRSYLSGKWHIMGAPDPLADAGFDHAYVLDDHDRNFNPRGLREDGRPLPPVAKGSGYYTTTACADHAIRCLQEHAAQHAGRPFFTYLAFTVPHFPLHAPPEDIARYRDRYRAGWDVLRAERQQRLRTLGLFEGEPAVPEPAVRAPSGGPEVERKIGPDEVAYALPWASLSEAQQRFQSDKMAVHAAMVDRMDREIGRVLEQVRAMGAWTNTVILFLSDNGASAEILLRGDGHDPAAAAGSAESFLCLGPGWSSAANAPFRRHKIWTYEGGVSTPLIVHWPAGVAARGDRRRTVGHVVDVVPTLLELAGLPPVAGPGAPALPGRSLAPALAADVGGPDAPVFFQHAGNRALRVGDLKLVSARDRSDAWELYDLSADRGEQHDLAAAQPDRVAELAAQWLALADQFVRDAGPVGPGAARAKEKGP